MILHLSAAGVPISWSIIALYGTSYGVARASAAKWYEASVDVLTERPRSDSPQYVCDLVGDEEKGYVVKRDELWMAQDHLQRQTHDRLAMLVQHHSAPLPLPPVLSQAVTDALRARLVDFGYIIPTSEWQRRYPGQALVSARFREFADACGAWKAGDHGDAPLPFEPRWTPFMEMPKGFKSAYSLGEDCVCERTGSGRWRRIDPPELAGNDDHASIVRLLNAGWTPAQVAILLADEPIA